MNQKLNLTLEDGRKALEVHVIERGRALRRKYGNFIDYEVLTKILKDEEFVRFPTRIEFRSDILEEGMFALAERMASSAADGYVIYIHEYFQKKLDDVPALVLYHLVTVNYGDFATFNEAEVFASESLGMEQDVYYQLLCRLVEQIPKQ